MLRGSGKGQPACRHRERKRRRGGEHSGAAGLVEHERERELVDDDWNDGEHEYDEYDEYDRESVHFEPSRDDDRSSIIQQHGGAGRANIGVLQLLHRQPCSRRGVVPDVRRAFA